VDMITHSVVVGYCFTIQGARGPGDPSRCQSNWELVGVHFTSATEGWAVGFDQTNQTGYCFTTQGAHGPP